MAGFEIASEVTTKGTDFDGILDILIGLIGLLPPLLLVM